MFSEEADKRILGLGLIEYITVQNTLVQNRIDFIDTEYNITEQNTLIQNRIEYIRLQQRSKVIHCIALIPSVHLQSARRQPY